jgi:hypothetical protein
MVETSPRIFINVRSFYGIGLRNTTRYPSSKQQKHLLRPVSHPGDLINGMKKPFLLRFINIWPPMLGAGIRVQWLDPEMRAVDVTMKLRRWNKNFVGTHYGGSLYSMADPFFMVMLIQNLGREYIVWDKAATIRFRKPGRGMVKAQFRLTEAVLEDIRTRLETQEKYEPTFRVQIKDEAGEVIAEVEKLLYIRRKQSKAVAAS